MESYKIRPMVENDLADLSSLTPEGWRDIGAVFAVFLLTSSCWPLVADMDGRVIATRSLYGEWFGRVD